MALALRGPTWLPPLRYVTIEHDLLGSIMVKLTAKKFALRPNLDVWSPGGAVKARGASSHET
jgi:hypothetical protein